MVETSVILKCVLNMSKVIRQKSEVGKENKQNVLIPV